MSKILATHPKSVQSHKDLILQCLDDKDESIRLRALDLIYGMVGGNQITNNQYCILVCIPLQKINLFTHGLNNMQCIYILYCLLIPHLLCEGF